MYPDVFTGYETQRLLYKTLPVIQKEYDEHTKNIL